MGLSWDDSLAGSMSNYFLTSGISFSGWVAISIDMPNMIASFIVVALAAKVKLTNQASYSVVFRIELFSMLDVGQILMQIVTDASDEQIEDISRNGHSNRNGRSHFKRVSIPDDNGHDYTCDQEKGSHEGSAVERVFLLH